MLNEPTNCSWVCVDHRVGWLAQSVLCVLAGVGCAAGHSRLDRPAWEQSRLIDLTHSFGADTIVWPTEQDFRLVLQQAGRRRAGTTTPRIDWRWPNMAGTHIDAPIHFAKGGQTLDQVPIERLVGTGVRIDVTAQCARDRDYRVTIQDFERWEATHGRISDSRDRVSSTRGLPDYWPSRQRYLGTEMRGREGVQALHFPGLHPEAAAWLVRERQVKAVGIDTASID